MNVTVDYLYGFGKYEKCYKEEEEGIHKPSHYFSPDIPGRREEEGEGGREVVVSGTPSQSMLLAGMYMYIHVVRSDLCTAIVKITAALKQNLL